MYPPGIDKGNEECIGHHQYYFDKCFCLLKVKVDVVLVLLHYQAVGSREGVDQLRALAGVCHHEFHEDVLDDVAVHGVV